jgi:hypothetical protein
MTGPEDFIAQGIFDLVPHWYRAEHGPHQFKLEIGAGTFSFCAHQPLSADWQALRDEAGSRAKSFLSLAQTLKGLHLLEHMQDSFAVFWLARRFSWVDWKSLVQYLSAAARRSYENRPVSANFIISRKVQGRLSILDPCLNKFLDPLTSSPDLFLGLDGSLALVDLDQLSWANRKSAVTYKYHSEYLANFWTHLDEDEVAVHLSSQGDCWFLSRDGLLASRRRARWCLHDTKALRQAFVEIFQNEWIGTNLMAIAYSLSFERRGALLIFDPRQTVVEHLLNPESRFGGAADVARSLLEPAVSKIKLSDPLPIDRKLLLTGAAGMDGAVIFSADRILAVGAMVQPHSAAGKFVGARATAAFSAYLHGGIPIQVSSDGDLTLYFKSANGEKRCDAQMSFL